MKRFLVLILAAFGSMQINAHADKPADRVTVKVNEDFSLSLDEKFADKATLLFRENGKEYHLYTKDTIIVVKNDSKEFWLSKHEDNSFQFYQESGVLRGIFNGYVSNTFYIGIKSGFPATKFKLGKDVKSANTIIFIHKPISEDYLSDPIGRVCVTTSELSYNNLKVTDTVYVNAKDTASLSVSIIKPEKVIYNGLSVNGKLVDEASVDLADFYKSGKIPEKSIKSSLLSKDCNIIQVNYLTMDENGAMKGDHADEFVVIRTKDNSLVTLLGVILSVVIVVVIALAFWVLKSRKKDKDEKWASDFVAAMVELKDHQEKVQEAKKYFRMATAKLYPAEVKWLLAKDKDKAKRRAELDRLNKAFADLLDQFNDNEIGITRDTWDKIFEEQIQDISNPAEVKKIAVYRLLEAKKEIDKENCEMELLKMKKAYEILEETVRNHKIEITEGDLNPGSVKIESLSGKAPEQTDATEPVGDIPAPESDSEAAAGHNEGEAAEQKDDTDYKEKYAECLAELEKIRNDNNNLTDQVDALGKEKAKADSRADELHKKLAAANDEKLLLKDQVDGLTAQNNKAKKDLEQKDKDIAALAKAHEQALEEVERQHKAAVESLEEAYKKELADKDLSIEDLRKVMSEDREYLFNFYKGVINETEELIATCVKNSDEDSKARSEFNMMISTNNSFGAFKNYCYERITSDSPVSVVLTEICERLLKNLNYEKSWCNALARLYAYSKVECLKDVFGYYEGSYEEDIRMAFNSMCRLAEVLEISRISVPELFVDTYSRDKYDFKNTNLVLPGMYPDYGQKLTPKIIYDVLKLGYTCHGETVKSTVAYSPEHL